MRKIAISDCDHVNMAQEEAIFEKNNIVMTLYQCRTEEDLIRDLQGYEAIGVQYAPLTERVFKALPDLKCVVRYGVGVDNIDMEAATGCGVKVCNVPDYGVQEVATQAVTMMLALCRKLVPMNESVRRGEWQYEQSIPVWRMRDLTLGILGAGRIGSCFAELMRPFGCRIIAYDPIYHQIGKAHRCDFIEMVSLKEVLTQSDMISIHAPLETSRKLIGREELQMMKETAYLVNVSRGGIIDEEALAEALEQKWIAGAAIDVVEEEPPGGVHPCCKYENFLCTPHMAWYSEEAAKDMKSMLAEELVRYLNGEPLRCPLN